MMNLTHPAHRGLPGFSAANALSMVGGTYPATSSLHQRSPFAIQELLGLGQPQDSGHHLRHNSHLSAAAAAASETVISASSYIPRTLGGGLGPVSAVVSQTAACLNSADAVTSSHFTPSWRPSFMNAFSAGVTAHSPQTMIGLSGSQPSLLSPPNTGDVSTGKSNASIQTHTETFDVHVCHLIHETHIRCTCN